MSHAKKRRLLWEIIRDYTIAQREVMKAHREAQKAKPRSRIFRKIYEWMMDWEDTYLIVKYRYNKHDRRSYA